MIGPISEAQRRAWQRRQPRPPEEFRDVVPGPDCHPPRLGGPRDTQAPALSVGPGLAGHKPWGCHPAAVEVPG